MDALIDYVIGPNGFEVARDAIGAMLLTELTNQKALQQFDEPVNIYRGRMMAIQTDELLYINVIYDSSAFANYTQVNQQGRTVYFVDVYSIGENVPADGDTPAISGAEISDRRLQKFMGMCRHILASPMYVTLGIDPSLQLIGGKFVESMATDQSPADADSSYSRMGRITFVVNVNETQRGWQGVTLDGIDTKVTDKGIQYVFDTEE